MPIRREIPNWKEHPLGSKADRVQEEVQKMEMHPMIAQFHPELLGEGSEHAVFSFPGRDKIVGKIRLHEIAALLAYNYEHGHQPDVLPEEIQQNIAEREKNERERFALLREYFGDMCRANEE